MHGAEFFASTFSPCHHRKMTFRRVVVLMMENHSFDHLLGWVPGIGTLDGTQKQRADGSEYTVGAVADPRTANRFDPNHDFANVVEQLYGKGGITPRVAPAMQGFLQNNLAVGYTPEDYLACYLPEQVPVLAALATRYVTCARWFSSVPAATGPNQLFAHCATSGGYFGNDYNPAPDFVPPMRSIFNALDEQRIPWAIYWDGSFSTARALAQLQSGENFRPLEAFAHDVAHEKQNFPRYVFVTPSLRGTATLPANSMHPGFAQSTVAAGEALIRSVYVALAPVWNETLLLIVFDEHGGWWDSVAPPTGLPPAAALGQPPLWSPPMPSARGGPFDFMVYGARVPAIVVSAWHSPLLDNETIFEHASIPATLKELFGLPAYLTPRDACAPTFHNPWPLSSSPSPPITLPEPWSP
jgi:phospholipase C